jgi:hypothetical protein
LTRKLGDTQIRCTVKRRYRVRSGPCDHLQQSAGECLPAEVTQGGSIGSQFRLHPAAFGPPSKHRDDEEHVGRGSPQDIAEGIAPRAMGSFMQEYRVELIWPQPSDQ